MAKPDILISVMRYGRERIANPVTLKNIIDHMIKKGYKVATTGTIKVGNDPEKQARLSNWQICNDACNDFFDKVGANENGDDLWRLRQEGYFKLIEYERLELSRTMSRLALFFSIIAIIAGGVSMSMAGYNYYRQITSITTVQLDEPQIEQVQTGTFRLDSILATLANIDEKMKAQLSLLEEQKKRDIERLD